MLTIRMYSFILFGMVIIDLAVEGTKYMSLICLLLTLWLFSG